ncbi:MAG: Gfo/Idh/MocA family oxidoreductase [Rhodospirillaceae bacterium]|nr:Gfo/Idh/MocA family oxidoreductase [Rhodospirillales bacterium]
MKALVIGFGSIGQRHARVLAAMGHDVAVVSRRPVDHPRLYGSLTEAVQGFQPDYVVIASRTNEHGDDLAQLAGLGFQGLVLVEKPLFEAAKPLPANRFQAAFVAYNLRFHPVIRALRDAVVQLGGKPVAVRAAVGQYLPFWRPGTDYRTSYSASAAQGGGVLRDLSHELDYLTWIFGNWRDLAALGGKLSSLEIDSEDTFAILARLSACPVVTLQLNYLDHTRMRDVVATFDGHTVRADLAAGTVSVDGVERHFVAGPDDTYLAQHAALLDGRHEDLCPLSGGLDINAMIDAAEKAAREGRWVQRGEYF